MIWFGNMASFFDCIFDCFIPCFLRFTVFEELAVHLKLKMLQRSEDQRTRDIMLSLSFGLVWDQHRITCNFVRNYEFGPVLKVFLKLWDFEHSRFLTSFGKVLWKSLNLLSMPFSTFQIEVFEAFPTIRH